MIRGDQRPSCAHEGRQPDAQVDVISVSELERRAPSNPLAIRRHGVPFGPFPGEGEALDTTLGRSLHNPLDEEAPSAGAIRGRNQQSEGAITCTIRSTKIPGVWMSFGSSVPAGTSSSTCLEEAISGNQRQLEAIRSGHELLHTSAMVILPAVATAGL